MSNSTNNTVVTTPTIITEEYFKEFCPVPLNFQVDDIKPYFRVAEIIWVKPIIGQALYDELLEQVESNNVTDVNATLLLNIYPYEAFAICYESLPFLAYRVNEVGITRGKTDNADAIEMKEINYINSHLQNQLEIQKKELKRFLDENADHFPLYTREDDCDCRGRKFSRLYAPHAYQQAWSTDRKDIDIE